ncbi:MAG: hypothetical protein AAB425_06810 [Bdellovibrionota bacterium]
MQHQIFLKFSRVIADKFVGRESCLFLVGLFDLGGLDVLGVMLLSKISAAISKMVSPLTTASSRDTNSEDQPQHQPKQGGGNAPQTQAAGANPGLKVDLPKKEAPKSEVPKIGEDDEAADNPPLPADREAEDAGKGNVAASLASTFLQIIGNVHSGKNPALRKIGALGYAATMRKRKRRSLKGMVVDESIE